MLAVCDWEILRAMRLGFLGAENGLADYWATPTHLGLYDRFFAERIGWKWDAALTELTSRGFSAAGHVVDWGCGTGVAVRRFLERFPGITDVTLHDRSYLALRFATDRLRADFPAVTIHSWNPTVPPDAVYLLSHVLNELPTTADLRDLLATHANTIVWVESGTHATSRRLIGLREELREDFSLLAPCPHDGACGLLTSENAQHWCHHFTKPPGWVHHDPDFSAFARELEIDLGTVPYSWFAMGKTPASRPQEKTIGRPRIFKGYAKILTCEASGVTEKTVQKRVDPAAFRALRKTD